MEGFLEEWAPKLGSKGQVAVSQVKNEGARGKGVPDGGNGLVKSLELSGSMGWLVPQISSR